VPAAVKASCGRSLQQRICDLVVPGSHMAVRVLQHLYRLRYNEVIADSSQKAVERLRGLGPEVFLLEETEGGSEGEMLVTICMTESAIRRWSQTPKCK
jgi:hypothetical protein